MEAFFFFSLAPVDPLCLKQEYVFKLHFPATRPLVIHNRPLQVAIFFFFFRIDEICILASKADAYFHCEEKCHLTLFSINYVVP